MLDVHRDSTHGKDGPIKSDDAVHVVLAQIGRALLNRMHVDTALEVA